MTSSCRLSTGADRKTEVASQSAELKVSGLELPALIGALLSMRNQSRQTMRDGFFASVCGSDSLLRAASDRAFAKARERLHMPALVGLHDLVVRRADEAGLIDRWCGLRGAPPTLPC